MFTDKITNQCTRQVDNDLNYLKESHLPTILYGAGVAANMVISEIFPQYDTTLIDHIVVDRLYYQADTYFKNIAVEPLEDVLNMYEKVNVIFALESVSAFQRLSQNDKIFKIITFDFVDLRFNFSNYFSQIEEHSTELEKFYLELSDELSRKILIEFINAKLTGTLDKLIEYSEDEHSHYFPSFLHLSDNEIFVDCGAYDGDTIQEFRKKVNNKYAKIYAFECDTSNMNKLRETAMGINNVELIPKGCWSEQTDLYFKSEGNVSSAISNDGNIKIEVDTIDNIVSSDNVSYIKMDIEGSELEALKGAKRTILQNLPKLAVSVYHKPQDLYTI